jgi:cytochrome c553
MLDINLVLTIFIVKAAMQVTAGRTRSAAQRVHRRSLCRCWACHCQDGRTSGNYAATT